MSAATLRSLAGFAPPILPDGTARIGGRWERVCGAFSHWRRLPRWPRWRFTMATFMSVAHLLALAAPVRITWPSGMALGGRPWAAALVLVFPVRRWSRRWP